MKFTIKSKAKKFDPITVEIELTTRDEAIEFAARMDLSLDEVLKQRKIRQEMNDTSCSRMSGITSMRQQLGKLIKVQLCNNGYREY